jgi:aspartate racemase
MLSHGSNAQIARLGLLGGLSWESTLEYYRQINIETNRRLGGLRTAEILIWSFDFGTIWNYRHAGDRVAITREFEAAIKNLVAGGAEFLAICSNSAHRRADFIAEVAGKPVVHIIDAVGGEALRLGCRRVGLLGTLDTTRESFYRDHLKTKFGLEAIVPSEADQELVHRIALEEISRGQRKPSSRVELCRITQALARQGADAVIFGCTELPLMLPIESDVPIIDSLQVHVESIVEAAMTAKSHRGPFVPPRLPLSSAVR